MAQPVTLSGPARVRLVLALNAAKITPFGPAEWGAYAGAMGDAHVVTFHAHHLDWLRQQLRLEHVPASCFFVVLDESGLTLNMAAPWNAYAWAVNISLEVDQYDSPGAEFWQVDFGTDEAAEIAALPEGIRSQILAAPESVQYLVLAGYKAAQAGVPAEQPQPAKPTRPKVWIFRGQISGNLESQAHLPAGTTEFQFSNGPDGRQSGSNDYVDLWEGLDAHSDHEFCTADAHFTPTEQGVYNRFVDMRGW